MHMKKEETAGGEKNVSIRNTKQLLKSYSINIHINAVIW